MTLHQADCLIAAAAKGISGTIATDNVDDFPMREVLVERWPVGGWVWPLRIELAKESVAWRTVIPYAQAEMVIRSVRHRGLRHLLQHDNPRFVRADLVGRVRNVLTVIALADDLGAFLADAPRGWRVHRLSGDRRQEWSVSVSGNWRITFEEDHGLIDALNLEDYH